MRHRGTTPTGGIDTADLRPVVDVAGPFATLLLDTDPAVENAAARLEQRWNSERRDLQSRGASESALARIDAQVAGAHLRGRAFYAVVDAERCWIADAWSDAPEHEVVRWAALPTLTPLLAHRQTEVPHVVALVDREGADIVTVTPGDRRRETVEGESGPVIRRSAPGGWSQRRYQQRAEDEWARTAREIARALAAEVDAADAQVVVLAGDVRAVQLVTDDLPTSVRERVHVAAGGRAPGTDQAALAATVTRWVRTAAAEASVALLRKLREEVGQRDRAVVGADATFAALAQGQVEVLLVHDDPADDRTAWFGAGPLAIGIDPETATIGGGEAERARLVDVAVRAAIGGGAEVRVVPNVPILTDGLAAILRWAD